MLSFYPYLAASLPMLHFGAKPPFSFEQYLDICRGLISEDDFAVLRDLPQPKDYGLCEIRNEALRQWVDFDASLRNELALLRGRKHNVDASVYLRSSSCTDYTISQVALSASRIPSMLDAERFLDEQRWNALDEIVQGHFFDPEFAIVYAYKLMIAGRWAAIQTADKTALIQATLNVH